MNIDDGLSVIKQSIAPPRLKRLLITSLECGQSLSLHSLWQQLIHHVSYHLLLHSKVNRQHWESKYHHRNGNPAHMNLPQRSQPFFFPNRQIKVMPIADFLLVAKCFILLANYLVSSNSTACYSH